MENVGLLSEVDLKRTRKLMEQQDNTPTIDQFRPVVLRILIEGQVYASEQERLRRARIATLTGSIGLARV